MIRNTSYKVQVDVDSDETRLQYNIEDGAFVTTSSGVWTVWNGEWKRLYPQAGSGTSVGWARYDDSTYTSSNKLNLADGVEVVLPNNGATIYRSHSDISYYNSTTQKVIADFENDTYIMTVVFRCSAANANQTYLSLHFQGENGTPYDRIRSDVNFPKGNDVSHDYHQIFQYYSDSSFLTNGTQWKITSNGGSASIWDIIFFIQKVQNYG